MRMISLMIFSLTLAGCASTQDYELYLQAQAVSNKQALDNQKPLVRLVAQPGMQITGLQSLEVFTPQSLPVIQQQRPSEWAAVVSKALDVTGTIGGIYFGGKAVVGIATQVKEAGIAGYNSVQAPGPVNTSTITTTTNTNNTMTSSTGVLGSGTYNIDSTHTPTVVTQPAPVIVNQPSPIVVNQPAPIVITQPEPIIVQTPDPVIVTQPPPVIVN